MGGQLGGWLRSRPRERRPDKCGRKESSVDRLVETQATCVGTLARGSEAELRGSP